MANNQQKVTPAFNSEIDDMKKAIFSTFKNISDVTYLGKGGSSIITCIEYEDGTKKALKVLRDSRIDDANAKKALKAEFALMNSLSNQCDGIVNVYKEGTLDNLTKNNYYLMEYSELGSLRDMLEANYKDLHSDLQVVRDDLAGWLPECITMLLDTMCQIHEKKYCHLDIKEQNILLFNNNGNIVPKISDFGSARKIIKSDKLTKVEVSYLYAPKIWQHLADIKEATSHQRVEVPIKQKDILPWVDLHMFGVALRQIVQDDNSYDEARSSIRENIKEIVLLFSKILGEESRMPKDYKTIDTKIAKDRFKSAVIDQFRIRDIVGEKVRFNTGRQDFRYVSDRVKSIVTASMFLRLKDIRQLGLAYKVNADANHTRYAHSLGVYEIACQICENLMDINGNPWMRMYASREDILLTILAALLHDLGQFPFAHYLEDQYPFMGHAELTEGILENSKLAQIIFGKEDIVQFANTIKEEFALSPDKIANLLKIARTGKGKKESNSPVYHALGTILDGPLDADKLDYLVRDADHCGVKYGGIIERDQLINNFTINTSAQSAGNIERFVLSVKSYSQNESSRIAAELVAVARYAMFTSVYLRNDVCSFAAMLRRAIILGLRDIFKTKPKQKNVFLKNFINNTDDGALIYAASFMETNKSQVAAYLLKNIVENIGYIPFVEISERDELVYNNISTQFALSNMKEKSLIELETYMECENIIISAATDVLGRPVEPGDLIIDIPRNVWDKSREFKRMAIIDNFYCAHPVGNLWDAILSHVHSWVFRIRLFIHPRFKEHITPARVETMRDRLIDIFSTINYN